MLRWLIEAGADEAITETPKNRFGARNVRGHGAPGGEGVSPGASTSSRCTQTPSPSPEEK